MNEVAIKNTRILFRNFSGLTSRYNTGGDRTFSVVIPDNNTVNRLTAEGWNVKTYTTEQNEPIYYVPVTVRMDSAYPIDSRIFVISDGTEVMLDSKTVGFLDHVEIKDNADVILYPYRWNIEGRTGVKAYLKTMHVALKNKYTIEKFKIPQKGDYKNANEFTEALDAVARTVGALFPYHTFVQIKDVIFNDPATIVLWSDGDKTVVKVAEGEIFDPEKGLAMAISKKHFGNGGNYYNRFKKWLPKKDSPTSIQEQTNHGDTSL